MNNNNIKVYSKIVSDLINIKDLINTELSMEGKLKLIRRGIRDVKEYDDWESREFLGIKLEQIEMMIMLGYDELIINELNMDIKWGKDELMNEKRNDNHKTQEIDL